MNIRTTKFDETISFFVDVLGMRRETPTMPPNTPERVLEAAARNAAWIFDGAGDAVVHMGRVDPADPEGIARMNAHLGAREIESLQGSGAIDHIAFEASDYEGLLTRIKAHQCDYFERVTRTGARQIFVHDPNQIKIELNFVPEA